ncbi:formate/nitrite transporter family protein [Tepidibacillus sp. HK-1]|uniref:formate/nitrite transporter family protein n=1 Tax=Tepidibacillus sp. HK-1 TaxID=1883407 RepID=UPI0008589145|nr:formate transporter [Tepidibacillus sp. HK-1]
MDYNYHNPQRIAKFTVEQGVKKAKLPLSNMLVLGFLAGAFIAMGFLLDVRVVANLPKDWGTFGSFLGAAVFPVGLIFVLIAGGELLTGNMMAVSIAWYSKIITSFQLVRNWFWITISNFVPVYLGNAVEGCFAVASAYWFTYIREDEMDENNK